METKAINNPINLLLSDEQIVDLISPFEYVYMDGAVKFMLKSVRASTKMYANLTVTAEFEGNEETPTIRVIDELSNQIGVSVNFRCAAFERRFAEMIKYWDTVNAN